MRVARKERTCVYPDWRARSPFAGASLASPGRGSFFATAVVPLTTTTSAGEEREGSENQRRIARAKERVARGPAVKRADVGARETRESAAGASVYRCAKVTVRLGSDGLFSFIAARERAQKTLSRRDRFSYQRSPDEDSTVVTFRHGSVDEDRFTFTGNAVQGRVTRA